MKPIYVKPAMVTYNRSDIMEMIGPVKTQYVPPPPQPPIEHPACVVRVAPAGFLQGKVLDLQVELDSPHPAFHRVRIEVPGSSPLIQYEINRADGSFSDNRWSVTIAGFQFLGDRGSYPVVVRLYDAKNRFLSSCQTTIAVE